LHIGVHQDLKRRDLEFILDSIDKFIRNYA